jgi:hypothetical protein
VCADEVQEFRRSFGVLEVHEAEATKLAEFSPVSFLQIQTIAITLDGEFVRWFWAGIAFDRVDTPLLDLCDDADMCNATQCMEVEESYITTPWTLRGCPIDDVLDW